MEKKWNKWFIAIGAVLALIILLISLIYIQLTPIFYVIPFFLILFGIISYTNLNIKWVTIIALIIITIVVSILLFFSWLSQTEQFRIF